MMKQTIIITGINGFLGNRLKEFLTKDYLVYGIAKEESINKGVKTFSSKKIKEIDIVPDYLILCHAAVSSGNTNQENDLLYAVNVRLTDQIISKFNSAKIIYISSASIYNAKEEVIKENTVNSPITEYAISKYWAEKLVIKTKKAVVIRLSSLFGPYMKENTIIPNYINHSLNSKCIEVWGKGNRQQNYIFIDDVCNLILATLVSYDKVKNKILLGVNHEEHSNLDLAKIIAQTNKSKIEFINEDNSISIHYNNKLTQELLNWMPKANFEQEIINYMRWKQKQS